MQTIVNLVSAGLGVAWVPLSVRQFQRSGVLYRDVRAGDPAGRAMGGVGPRCETSLVWRGDNDNPALARFVAYVQAHPDEPEAAGPG